MNNLKSSSLINPGAAIGESGDDPRIEWKTREGGHNAMDGSENVLIVPDAMLKKWKGDVIKIPGTKSPGSVLSGMGGDIIKGSGQKCLAEESGDEEEKSGKTQKGVPTGKIRLLNLRLDSRAWRWLTAVLTRILPYSYCR
jgi:hypothetical protein